MDWKNEKGLYPLNQKRIADLIIVMLQYVSLHKLAELTDTSPTTIRTILKTKVSNQTLEKVWNGIGVMVDELQSATMEAGAK